MKLSWRFPDPSLAGGTDEEKLAEFRKIRDGIRARVKVLAARI